MTLSAWSRLARTLKVYFLKLNVLRRPKIAHCLCRSELDGNCYDNPGVNGTLDVMCSRELSCIPFQNYLAANGSSPLGPTSVPLNLISHRAHVVYQLIEISNAE